MAQIQIAIVSTTICRNTGETLNRRVVGYEEVDEEKYWRPLVEVLHRDFEAKRKRKGIK